MVDPMNTEYCLLTIQSWCMTRGEWASWMQVLGAVGAIFISAWVVDRQHRLENKRRRAEHLEASALAAEALQGPIDELLAVCQELHAMGVRMDVVKANDTEGFDNVYSRFARASGQLRLHDPTELPSARLRAVLLNARHAVNPITSFSQMQYNDASKCYEYGDPTHQTRMNAVIDHLTKERQAVAEAVLEYRRALV
jgi:HAMP domain-containing protein